MAYAKSNIALSLAYIQDPAAKLRELCSYAGQVEVEASVPARRYLRSGLEMLRMARVYNDEGDHESAFILYMKFITLFVEKLPRHPGYKQAPQTEITNMKQKVKQVFPVAEEIKTQLRRKYEETQRIQQAEQKRKAEEFAAEQARLREEDEARRREDDQRQDKLRSDAEELWLREQEQRFRELQEREKEKVDAGDKRDPNILIDVPLPGDGRPIAGLNNERERVPKGTLEYVPNDLRRTPRPKLEKNLSIDQVPPGIPDRELKKSLTISDSKGPEVDRSTKPPVDHFLTTGVSGTNKYGLKDVIVPRDIIVKFLAIAQTNTSRNIETCGILSGKFERNAFYVTHVLVPKQVGTSDRCDAEGEEDLFEFQDSHDLLSLGWIHTHPTQTAFLSSVDLHTHYPYQQLMPESIAIVCSPKFNETGIFMLTPDRGLPEVAKCQKRGHHEHTKNPPVFEACQHAKFVDNQSVVMADLR